MARCEECLHKSVCLHRANIQSDTYAYMGVSYDTEKCEHYKPTADVVPKSEYDRLEKLFNDMTQEAKGYLNRIYGIRADVAREIFAAIEFDIHNLDFDREETRAIAIEGVIANLKKIYTEGESNGSKQ